MPGQGNGVTEEDGWAHGVGTCYGRPAPAIQAGPVRSAEGADTQLTVRRCSPMSSSQAETCAASQ